MDMNFLKQYLRIINYALIGLVFAFASFYLLSNMYHYLEIRKDFVTTFAKEDLVLKYEEKLQSIQTNISDFDVNTYQGNVPASQMTIIAHQLNSCVASFRNETFQSMMDKNRITIIDVYNLREAYANDILGDCIVNNLFWTSAVDQHQLENTILAQEKDLIQLYYNNLFSETSYLKQDLLNNSSYYYNTAIASSSMKSNTRDGFYEVMGSYNKAVNFVEYISKWFHQEISTTGGALENESND